MFALVLSTFDTRRSVGAAVGSGMTTDSLSLFLLLSNNSTISLKRHKVTLNGWSFSAWNVKYTLINLRPRISVGVGFDKLISIMYLLTVLSRVSNDHIGLRSWSKLIPGLDFDLIRHIGFYVLDNMFGLHCGHITPLLPQILLSPPHAVAEVGSISLQIKQRLMNKIKNSLRMHTYWKETKLFWHGEIYLISLILTFNH